MLFEWNEQTFRWFYEASEYTGYNREMARLLLPRLAGCDTLCDMGCGMALVDFELAPYFQTITCVDVSPEAVRNVKERSETLGVSNLQTICSDGMAAQGSWDAVMALFHGDVETMGENYLQKARKKLILVVHGSAYGSTGPEKYRVRKCCDVDHTRAWLERNQIPYDLELAALEFGQPHRSLEDAVAYTRTFSKAAPETELQDYVRSHVKETGREDFPLYTPKQRSFGIFTIRKEDSV